MLVLVTDTSGKQAYVALARSESPTVTEIIDSVALVGGTFSAQLVPQIWQLLSKHDFSKKDIEALIVVSGPGSFTGLRVGLAAIKALGEILRKPIVPVSLLEAIALAGHRDGKVFAALDAGRGEVYVGAYEIVSESARLLQEQLLARDEFLSVARHSAVVTPDAVLSESLQGRALSVMVVDPANAKAVAGLGLRKLQAGQVVSPEQLEANYIRRSDAEIFSTQNS
jgi:tRNA threonylcarbamoyladenosine biosynthesis protein TsaB